MAEVPGKKINLLLDRNSSSTFPPSKMMADVGSDDQIGKFYFHRINGAYYFKNYCLNYASVEGTDRPYLGKATGDVLFYLVGRDVICCLFNDLDVCFLLMEPGTNLIVLRKHR